MRPGLNQLHNVVILDGLHSLDSLASAVLGPEIVSGHALDIAKLGESNDGMRNRDQVLGADIIIVKTDLCAAVITVLVGDLLHFLLHHGQKLLMVGQNPLKIGYLLHQFPVLRLQLLPFQTCQGAKTHINDSLGLGLGQGKPPHQLFFCNGDRFRGPDDFDDLVDVVQGRQQTL